MSGNLVIAATIPAMTYEFDTEAMVKFVLCFAADLARQSSCLCSYGRINVRQMVLAFFGQVLCVPDPPAGFAGTSRFVMAQLAVQALDKLDAFTKKTAE